MIEVMDKSKESFSIGFKGKNDIDLKELISTLDGTIELIDFVSNSLDKNSFIKVNVQGSRKGSFIIDLCVLAKEGLNLINVPNITYAKLCIDTVCGLFTLKKHLKGEKAKSVFPDNNGNVVIENKDTKKLTINTQIYNIYGVESNQAMKRIFSNCGREGFYIENQNKKIFEIDKNEFSNMTKDIESVVDEKVIKSNSKIIVSVKKADFIGESKWELMYKTKCIKAAIKDERFIENLHNGNVSITAKTNMEIELLTETYLNEIGEQTKTVHYINEVIKISNTDELKQLKFEYSNN
ncbi:hypothetical protein [Clostridium sartagoforme]|uniref:hypothetical protein n=1 Tax=Clostridium sartagoforme TaxID=84031 RepID=UPI0031DC0306